ncbi:MAG TPA: bifunctional precorrin-2 dehydrogenase/sirohydrochlorin ferrochelatase [Candidatus Binataceae bacterium]|nr:bifunctional precorrin-2 dehydrogenase/sirohydrochlorin ferrochelatase [Candidatus Binataceae bacterium]
MGYLPIYVAMDGLRCVVVGGGAIAARKAAQLLAAGAVVTVISPRLGPALAAMAKAAAIVHHARKYAPGDLRGFDFAFAASDDAGAHREIFSEARALGVMLNVADSPELCDFIVPAIVRRGDLQIAVSTSGASPAVAARIRRELEARFGYEYECTLRLMRAARDYLFANDPALDSRAKKLKALAESNLTERLRDKDRAGVERLLTAHLGAGLDALAVDPGDWFRAAPHAVARGR